MPHRNPKSNSRGAILPSSSIRVATCPTNPEHAARRTPCLVHVTRDWRMSAHPPKERQFAPSPLNRSRRLARRVMAVAPDLVVVTPSTPMSGNPDPVDSAGPVAWPVDVIWLVAQADAD